jgi:hypothetical protein
MASILDLPPELIITILLHLAVPHITRSQGPSEARTRKLICPCADDFTVKEQLLTCAGDNSYLNAADIRRDVVRFGISHPYLMDCVIESGNCEMIDAWGSTTAGITVWRNIMTIPVTIR